MARPYCQSVPWLQEKKKIDFPPILPIDLTPDYESNTISVMMLNRQGATFFNVRCLEGEISP
jgi:hypothetical protein